MTSLFSVYFLVLATGPSPVSPQQAGSLMLQCVWRQAARPHMAKLPLQQMTFK